MDIVYEDEYILVIDKPHKMLVYPSPIAKNCHWFATKELAKLGYENLHTVHRLDRPTSGLLLFAKNKETAITFSQLFRDKAIRKTYICLVRGHTEEEGIIDKELKKDGEGELQEAVTKYKTLEKRIVDIEISKYPQSRFSFLEIEPETGRMHQIRRHLAHLRNPIIGDKRYGDRHYNRYMKEEMEMENLLLHAYKLEFTHPISQQKMSIQAPIPPIMKKVLDAFGFSKSEVLVRGIV